MGAGRLSLRSARVILLVMHEEVGGAPMPYDIPDDLSPGALVAQTSRPPGDVIVRAWPCSIGSPASSRRGCLKWARGGSDLRPGWLAAREAGLVGVQLPEDSEEVFH